MLKPKTTGEEKSTLPETNSSHLKMDVWKTNPFLLGWPIFRGYVSFGEGRSFWIGLPHLL